MKRFMLFVCSLWLITTVTAQPSMTKAQGPDDEDAYTPLILGDNVFSLLYPSRWKFDEDSVKLGRFVFASDFSILKRKAGQPYASGDIVVSLDLLITAQPIKNDDGLESILMQYLPLLQHQSDGKSFTGFIPTMVGPVPASEGTTVIERATFSIPNFSDGMIYLWRISDRVLGLAMVNTAPGEITLHEQEVLIFMRSVQFNTTPEDLIATLQQEGSGS